MTSGLFSISSVAIVVYSLGLFDGTPFCVDVALLAPKDFTLFFSVTRFVGLGGLNA